MFVLTARDMADIFTSLRLLVSCIKFGEEGMGYSCHRMNSYRMNGELVIYLLIIKNITMKSRIISGI